MNLKHKSAPTDPSDTPDPSDTIRLFTKPVRYHFISGGVIHHHSTVVLSRTKSGLRSAARRFWKTNRHISPEAA